MLPHEHSDRIQIAFDDHRLGFSLSAADPDIRKVPATLYHRLIDSLVYAA